MTIRKNFTIKHFIILVVVCLAAGFITGFTSEKRNFQLSKNLDIFNSIVKELDLFYVDTLNAEKTINVGIEAMLASLDPYTQYYPESQKEDFQFLATGEYGGIGALIVQRDSGVYISEPYEGMPSQIADLRAGDKLLKIDDTDLSQKTSSEVSDLLKGQANSKIVLTIERNGQQLTKEITRKKIVMKAVPYYTMLNDGIGYICLESFTDKAADETKEALLDLMKNHQMQALVLDLRNNPGGVLEDAVRIVNLFVPKGQEVLSTKGKVKQWDKTYKTTQDPVADDLPLVVLINRNSASASEIVAGALQDLDRAVIIGERSYGKGLVQSSRNLPYDGTLKVTISKYYIPSGRLIQAIDYTHRNEDGSVARVPKEKMKEFKTANGRSVYDGGGIMPDKEVESQKMKNIVFYLLSDFVIFDYATQYVNNHPTIAPIAEYTFTDEDFNDFKQFVQQQNFTYDKQSEKAMKELRSLLEFEGYYDGAKDEFAALEKKLNHNLDQDLETAREEIKEFLSLEIAKRYYFQRGEIIQGLKKDRILDASVQLLKDPELYKKTLLPSTGKEAA